MGSHFKLFAAVLVLMNRTQNGDNLLFGRERNRTGYAGACTLCRLHNLVGGLIHQLVIVTLDSDSDFLLDLSLIHISMPKPTWPSPSPTTTKAANLKIRPPLTVLETRLMATTRSFISTVVASNFAKVIPPSLRT